jgi:hypothetical protein
MTKFTLPKPEITSIFITLSELEHISACLAACYDEAFEVGGDTLNTHCLTRDIVNAQLKVEYERRQTKRVTEYCDRQRALTAA